MGDQLAEIKKQNVLLRTALDMIQWGNFHFDHTGDGQHYCPECGNPKQQSHAANCPVGIALEATQDLSGCLLCDADPAAMVIGDVKGNFAALLTAIPPGTSLYMAKELKCS